ncbi:MAG: aspartate/glutamate racemase family protein [Sulfolobales archaeon]
MYGWRCRIGLIVPSSNTTMEPEFWRMAPEGVSIHASRVRLSEVTPEALKQMSSEAVRAAEELTTAEVDVIVYGCTSGSLLEGVKWEESLRREIESRVGVKTVTTAQAVAEALRTLGLKRVAVATPYIEEINAREKAFLESVGFTVVRIRGLGIVKNTEIGKQPTWVAYRLAKEVVREAKSAVDGVFISCTNFRTLEVVGVLEEELGLPVVSSNTASMWLALRTAGIRDKLNYGRLLREH